MILVDLIIKRKNAFMIIVQKFKLFGKFSGSFSAPCMSCVSTVCFLSSFFNHPILRMGGV